jgi:sigma-B regulation protein RsbU (phosphoserine phosphatase)
MLLIGPMEGEGREHRATVLVVEDDPSARRSLVRALEQEGHVAVEAHDGIEGLQLLQEIEPDVMLLDVSLRGLDGFGVLAAMQDLPTVAGTPVVMLAGPGDLAAALRCVEMGASDYVPRSPDPLVLRTRVNAALDLRRTRS